MRLRVGWTLRMTKKVRTGRSYQKNEGFRRLHCAHATINGATYCSDVVVVTDADGLLRRGRWWRAHVKIVVAEIDGELRGARA